MMHRETNSKDEETHHHPPHHYENQKKEKCNILELERPFLAINAMSILVDEHEPLVDVEDPPFEPRDVVIRTEKWITDEFEILGFLGRGKFGEVKRCKEIRTGREFAAKFIGTPRAQDRKEAEHEINIMKKLKHKRLLQMYDAFSSKDEMCLVLEIILGGELFDRVIDDDFILTERACVIFMRQICEGVEYMHKKNVIHLDLKPENILCLTRTGNRVKIIDFGLAREYMPGKDLRVLFGTPEFMAPEVVQYEPISFATDMWSVGVICYVLVSGLSPFMGDTDGDTLANIIRGDYDFDYQEFDDISDEAQDLIQRLIVKDKRKRLTAAECLEHPWLKRQADEPMTPSSPTLELSKVRLKRFVYRRKWQKVVNAIIALRRMGVQLSSLRQREAPRTYTLSPGIMANKSKRRPQDGASGAERVPADGAAASAAPPSEKAKPADSGSYVPGKRLKASANSKEEAMDVAECAASDKKDSDSVKCSVDSVFHEVSFSPDTRESKAESSSGNYKYDEMTATVNFSFVSVSNKADDKATEEKPSWHSVKSPSSAPTSAKTETPDTENKAKSGCLKNNALRLEQKSLSPIPNDPVSPDKFRPQNVSGTFSWPVKPSELRKKASKSPSPKSVEPPSPSTEGRLRYPRKQDFVSQKSFSKSPSPVRSSSNAEEGAPSPIPETIPENVALTTNSPASLDSLKPSQPIRVRASKTPSPQQIDSPVRQRLSKSPSPAALDSHNSMRGSSPAKSSVGLEQPRVRSCKSAERTTAKPLLEITKTHPEISKPKVPTKPVTLSNNRVTEKQSEKTESLELNNKVKPEPANSEKPVKAEKPIKTQDKPEKVSNSNDKQVTDRPERPEKPTLMEKPKILPKTTAIRMKPSKQYISRKDHFLNFAELRNNFDMTAKLNAAQHESQQRELRHVQRNDRVNKIKDKLTTKEGSCQEEDKVAINNVKNDLLDKSNNRGHVITLKVKHHDHHDNEHIHAPHETSSPQIHDKAQPKMDSVNTDNNKNSTKTTQNSDNNKVSEEKPKIPPKPNLNFKDKFNMFEQISR